MASDLLYIVISDFDHFLFIYKLYINAYASVASLVLMCT